MGETSPYGQKRSIDQIGERQGQLKIKRSQAMNDISDSDMNDSIDNMTSDEMFLPQVMQPQVTINESPSFDVNAVKRETNDVQQPQSPNTSGFRGSYRMRFKLQLIDTFSIGKFSLSPAENSNAHSMQNSTFSPYNFSDYGNNDMTMQNELKPSIHMDIPAGENSFLGATFLMQILSLSFIAQRNLSLLSRWKKKGKRDKKKSFFA